MDLLIPHACPALTTGPHSLVKGHQGPYVARNGALPPHWGEDRRATFESARDDAVMIMHRRGAPQKDRDNARLWLSRHGLDYRGRPQVWAKTSKNVNTLTLAG